MNKTVAEVASEFGVSRQAIYKIMKDNRFTDSFTVVDNNKTYITQDGQAFLDGWFNVTVDNTDTVSLQKLSTSLQNELTKERERNAELTNKILELSTQLVELTQNSQRILENEQKLKAMKKGFFQRIKERLT